VFIFADNFNKVHQDRREKSEENHEKHHSGYSAAGPRFEIYNGKSIRVEHVYKDKSSSIIIRAHKAEERIRASSLTHRTSISYRTEMSTQQER
jgi:hypothetical protein